MMTYHDKTLFTNFVDALGSFDLYYFDFGRKEGEEGEEEKEYVININKFRCLKEGPGHMRP